MPRSRDPSHNRSSVPTFLKRLARAAAVLAALILIALAVLHLPWVRGRVLDRARGYAERELGLALRSSGLGYNLLTRSIELRDLSVASTSAAEPFLEADRVAVVLGREIFRGRINVHRISVDRPRLTIVRFADGTVNLPASRESRSRPLRCSSGRVGDRTVGTAGRSRGAALVRGRAVRSGGGHGETRGRPGAFGPGAFTVRAGQTELRARSRQTRLRRQPACGSKT